MLRAKRGLNQQELADLINKTRALISHIEVTSKVNFFTLTEIANALNVNISYFIGEDKSNNIVNENKQEYSTLHERLDKLENENKLLYQVIENQKEIISQLKEKVKK